MPLGDEFFEMMENMLAEQKARGHVPRTEDEVERLQEECRRSVNLEIINGVIVGITPEDQERWLKSMAETDAMAASDPEKYKDYRWQTSPMENKG